MFANPNGTSGSVASMGAMLRTSIGDGDLTELWTFYIQLGVKLPKQPPPEITAIQARPLCASCTQSTSTTTRCSVPVKRLVAIV